MTLSSLSVMAADQNYIVDFSSGVENDFTSEELKAISEEVNEDNTITVIFNEEVLSEYAAEEIAEIEEHVCQDINKHYKEKAYVEYRVKAEHDCSPVGPYADTYGGINYIYNSQGKLIAYMQMGVCKYPPARGCARLVYKYTYL